MLIVLLKWLTFNARDVLGILRLIQYSEGCPLSRSFLFCLAFSPWNHLFL